MIVTLCTLLALTAPIVFGQFAGLKPAAGAAAEGKIQVPAGSDGATEIPITVARGMKPGPTLAVIAGLNGTEYGAVAATHQLLKELNLSQMSGTVVLVHIANLPAFQRRDIYMNPVDRKDLSRAFPGKADGTSTERMAHAITTEVIEKSDFVVVLRSSGSNGVVQPYVYQAVRGDTKLDAKIAAMAVGFGINTIVVQREASNQTALQDVALGQSKPAITVMCGSFGVVDNKTVDQIVRGLNGVLFPLEMMAGTPPRVRTPDYIDHTVALDSPAMGEMITYVQRGQHVRKGDAIYGVNDYHGKNTQVVRTPIDGIVLMLYVTPAVNKGETAAMIGTPRE